MVAPHQETIPVTENSTLRAESPFDTTDLSPHPQSLGEGQYASVPTPHDTADATLLQLPYDIAKTPTTPYQAAAHPLAWPLPGTPDPSLLLAALSALLYRYTQQDTIPLRLTRAAGSPNPCTHTLSIPVHSDLCLRHLLAHSHHLLQSSTTEPTASLPAQLALTLLAPEVTDPHAWMAQPPTIADLHLVIHPPTTAVGATLLYNAALFHPETIARLAGHLHGLLDSSSAHLDTPIAHLPLLTPTEAQQLLVDWASPRVEYPPLPIHAAIAARAAEQPEAIALSFKDQHLTYAELNHRANQLAHYLISLGVGAEVPVAVCVDPSLDILVCLLGIFKAGGVHVPLDPTYPTARLATILEDTQPCLILTQSHLRPHLPSLAVDCLCLDQDWATVHPFPGHNPQTTIALEQTAYIIYTSGTTGKPKGVMASYANLINYIRVAQDQYGFTRSDVMTAVARFSFSITMFELLSPLVAGGRLLILERDHVLDFKRLVQTLEQVTVVHASPSLLRKLVGYIHDQGLEAQRFAGLRHVSSGGDLVPADLLESLKSVFPTAELFVIYGCSEISCMGCTYPVPREQTVTKSRVGQPFPNVSVRLYDAQQQLVPIGVVGEIYFAGAGVTKGYLHREELTAEKYVLIDGQRWYRTGDLGRWDGAGNLEMLGRSDFQIKLRGIRIELGEIEATLRQVPGVREGVVVARSIAGSEPRLVAYVVLEPTQAPTVEQMHGWLQERLPDYMVPSAFVVLDAMPVNLNQKLDRKALPDPDAGQLGFGKPTYVAPSTPLEQQLAEIWATTLGLEQVGIQDNFFAIGGHSLLAAQVISRLQEALNLDIAISRLFEFPTIAALAEHLDALGQGDDHGHAGVEPIVPISRETDLPLSFSQEQLWFLSQLEGGGVAYNIPAAFKLVGTLDVAALEQSLTEIVRRHETLRTVFPTVNGVPVQRILSPQPFALSVVDLQALPESEQAEMVERLARKEAQHPFNLAADLLLHGQLLRLGETSHVLLLTMHHIASDGWSLAVFRRELAALYTAFSQGATSPLEPLPIQYADFAHWQQQRLTEEFLSSQLAYWKQQLAGAPSLLELPTDRSRPAVQTFRGGTESFILDAALTQQLKRLSQRTGTTLHMTLLSAFAILLSRYSGQQDLVIGSPVANRKRSDIESLIGFFINLLALRVDLTGDPGFLELLQRVRQVALDAYAHQDAPFEQVVEAVQPERNLSYSPLFQVLLILQNTPAEPLELPGLSLSPLKVDSGVAKYDLTLMMEETEAGLVAEFEYNGDLFDATTITRMIGHFQTLLQAIVTDPEQPIAALPLLTAAERQQLLVDWNKTDLEYPQEQCIHQLFESQVERTPDAIAAVFKDQTLTYRELNQRANQVAHYLQSLGVGPEVLVGISLERSLEMLVGLLGILKAGGSYVPLDPAFPKDRLALMIEDSQLALLLTQQTLDEQFAWQNVRVVRIDTDWSTIAQQSTENPTSTVTGENLAYTIYTSGSTGKPKGVQLMHCTAVNFLNSMRYEPGLTEHDVLLAVTTISFDIAVLELYLPLMVGARVIIATREVAADAARLSKLMAESGTTVLQATPATWRMLITGGWRGDGRLKMLCGGEAMPRDLADQLLERGGSLWNMYGPTETTVWSAACEVKPGTGSVPVAGPIANTQIYVLEELSHPQKGTLRPLPIGIPGEVHIGGDGLARGYLNRPELNQERFVADPFREVPGARLYKTGDLARFRPDGTLDFLGRIDNQVKLRGFRIELGEIEAVLGQYASVKQAVVMVREDAPGDQRLVAYLTTKGDAKPTALELRQFLKDYLPGYMIPTAFVLLESLPLTPNGKVDRRALPAPDLSMSDTDSREFVAPRNDVERQLTEIWETILNVKPIGIKDNFFDLGGHSLSAVRVWAQVEQLFGKTFPITTLLQSPTIEEIATILSTADGEAPVSDLVHLRKGGNKPPLFCIYGILLYRELVERLPADQPVYGVYVQEEVDLLKTGKVDQENAVFSSVPAIATRYLQAIRTLQPHGPYYLAGESFGGLVAFEMAQQLKTIGEETALIALFDAWAPNSPAELPRSERLKLHGQLLLKHGLSYIVEKVQGPLEAMWWTLSGKLRKLSQTFRPAADNAAAQAFNDLPEDVRQALRDQLRRAYAPKPYSGNVVLFRAMDRDPFEVDTHGDMGWGPLAPGLKTFNVPGDHLSILKHPNVQILADKLQRYLQ